MDDALGVVLSSRANVHDIEPRDGPADTELSGSAIASSHERVKARGAARGTGEDRRRVTSASRKKRDRRGLSTDREDRTLRSRENEDALTGPTIVERRATRKDERNCATEKRRGSFGVTYIQRGGVIEAREKARCSAITLSEGKNEPKKEQERIDDC